MPVSITSRLRHVSSLCADPQIYEMMKERIDTLQQQLAHYEQVKRFTLLPHHLSMEKGGDQYPQDPPPGTL